MNYERWEKEYRRLMHQRPKCTLPKASVEFRRSGGFELRFICYGCAEKTNYSITEDSAKDLCRVLAQMFGWKIQEEVDGEQKEKEADDR